MTPGRIAVTGASGFIGRALVRHLHSHGRAVVAVTRRGGGHPAGVREVQVADYRQPADLARAIAGAQGVVHLAALAHHRATEAEFEASVRAAETVAAAAVREQVPRLVLVSSIGVNGSRTHGPPFTEASAPAPTEPYARSKLRAEQAVAAAVAGSGTEVVVVRPPLVYGPHAPGNFGRLLRLVQRGWPLPVGSVRNARTFIAIDNLLDLLVLCLDHPAAAGELFLAGDAEDLSTPQLVRCIAQGLGRPARLAPFPPRLLMLAATLAGRRRLAESLCASLQVDASKARRVLGWRPRVAAEEGVRRAAREGLAS